MSDSLTGPKLVKTQHVLSPRIDEKVTFSSEVSRYSGKKPVVLLVLDGWGIGPKTAGNAVEIAKTPTLDSLWVDYPHTKLGASGEYVGLPKKVDGNSETGHMNIGAGKIIRQSLPRVTSSIESGEFFQNKILLDAFQRVKETGGKLHLMGLVGPGFVHSSVGHLEALLELANKQEVTQVEVHAFTDGRDSSPTIGLEYLQKLEDTMLELGVGRLATIMGRFYAMDRNRDWSRTQVAYDALTLGKGELTDDWKISLQRSYERNITDEFIDPIIIKNSDGSLPIIEDKDVVIFFNFRVDRPRQLTWAFSLPDFEYRNLMGGSSGQEIDSSEFSSLPVVNFQREKKYTDLLFVTMTDYDESLDIPKVFPKENILVNLGSVLSDHGVRQLRLTETEKEKMVTYYINGKREEAYPGEHWLIFPSKKTKSYADIPEMSAREIAAALVHEIEQDSFDVAVVNICNGDMVGHTGDLQAGIKACEVVDEQVKKIVEAILKTNGMLIITADHGNVEEMIDNETGEIDTAHSIYPVPCIFVGNELYKSNPTLNKGVLADLAPTILDIVNIDKPEEMTGRSLLRTNE